MSEQTLFPKAILSVNREEYYQEKDDPHPDSHQLPLPLTIKKQLTDEIATLPSELQGSVFTIAPVGAVDSPPPSKVEKSDPNDPKEKVVLPAKDGTSLLNGDGMMYRLDFNGGQASLSSRFVNTPSRYADRITCEKYPKLKFINLEVARLSISLGQSNQVNTAFLPMKFPGAENSRLLATWDAGIPYEIDPDSLKVIAPVGGIKDWTPLVKVPIVFPFEQLMTSAHPAFDPQTGEMFGANVVRSFSTLLWISRLFPFDAHKWIANLPNFLKAIAQVFITVLTWILTFLVRAVALLLELLGIGGEDCLYLMGWDGAASLQKWKVVLPNGRRVKIRQTVHQMGITQDYIIFADTSFKIVLEDLMPAVNPAVLTPHKIPKLLAKTEVEIDEKKKAEIKRRQDLLRDYLSYSQFPDTYLYIIDRAQLKNLPTGKAVTAQKVKIEREFAHFLTDYDNPNGKITIHAALNTATDPAEFIHSDDKSVFEIDEELRSMAGMLNNALAVNRPGFYVIDGATGKKEREEILDLEQAMKNTWYLALYAYRDQQPTTQFDEIYWLSFGAWTNTLSQFVYEMYKDYKYRQESLQTILDESKNGVPATLSRMKIDRTACQGEVLNIVDSYQFPKGYFASSPQFVPKDATQGYIVCPVIHSDNYFSDRAENEMSWSDNSEIWIFDAQKLSEGPQYRLSHSQLNLGFTLHTTWLQQVAATPTREYNIQQDFQEVVQASKKWHSSEIGQQIDELFAEVYAAFNRDRKST